MATQGERIASLESYVDGHGREHTLTERVWTAKLDAIESRLGRIERLLAETRDHDGTDGKRLSRRDVSLAGGAAALTTALWWLAELLQTAAGG